MNKTGKTWKICVPQISQMDTDFFTTLMILLLPCGQKSLENLFDSIDKFSQKADGLLKEKWPEFASRIKNLQEKVHSMKPDVSTLAGKFEQDIAQKITIASSACEVLLASGDEKNFASQLSELERIVNQRLRPSVSVS